MVTPSVYSIYTHEGPVSIRRRALAVADGGELNKSKETTFLEGFAPLAYNGGEMGDRLHLAFVSDGTEQVVGVCLHTQSGIIVGEVFGNADETVIRTQVARILSLDSDGSAFPLVSTYDPIIGQLQAHHPGLRPS